MLCHTLVQHFLRVVIVYQRLIWLLAGFTWEKPPMPQLRGWDKVSLYKQFAVVPSDILGG